MELGRTEVVMNSLDPVWIQNVNVAYQFEIVQPLVFRVYDVDTKYHNLSAKILWEVKFTVKLSTASLQMLKLNDQEFLGEGRCVLSEENPLVIECFDFNSSGNHVLIGKLQKSVADLEKLHTEKVGLHFIKPSSANSSHKKVLEGQLFVDQFYEKNVYSFIDYISSGFELNFMVAVDFTASNGNPQNSDSLHYIDPSGRLNAYQQDIMEVGEVIQFYDSDRRFPAWGFGGRTYNGDISHCFSLNGSTSGFEVEGVEGIMAAYAGSLGNVTLAGPTLFGQVINTAVEITGRSLSFNDSKYFVLLIITDGVLTNLQETKDALVRASDLPLSILIVGVGGADFTQMKIFDADNGH